MGVVFRFRNLRVVIRTKDHPPPHVHVLGPGGADMKIEIETLVVREVFGFHTQDVSCAVEFLRPRREALLRIWRSIHGGGDGNA